ncbi:MAG: nucleotidyltransferase domain-containing protein [Parachlamydiaceae bacterium]
MRISQHEQNAIKNVITQLDPQAKIYLFGSRVDDNARGGDIDLLILSELITERDRRKIRVELFEKLGEQKLDLVIAKDLSKPFVRLAYNGGVLL